MKLLISSIAICFLTISQAQTQAPYQEPLTNTKGSEYKFTVVKSLDATAVQNQNQTSTCWSFSSLSFFESELIRMGKGKEFNFAEMYVARRTYPMKADNFVRMHGRTSLSEGGGFPDVVNVIRKYGMVPEEVYTGKKNPKDPHNHSVLEATIKGIVKRFCTKKLCFTLPPNCSNVFSMTLFEVDLPVPRVRTWGKASSCSALIVS